MRVNLYKLCLLIGSVMCSITGVAENVPKQVSLQSSGGVSCHLFTGQAGYTIPIYKLDDPDFQLDIALRYQSDGFKPFLPSGFYGQDWSLIAGGYITRTVQGFPDEQKIANMWVNGYLEDNIGMQHALSEQCVYDKEAVFNFSSSVYSEGHGLSCSLGDGYGPNWWTIDYMPDIFYFSFMGHQGSFIIDNDGNPTIISGDFIDVDLSNWYETHDVDDGDYWGPQPRTYSEISIITKDGYKYVFGGKYGALEYSLSTNRDQSLHYAIPTIVKWNLSFIVAPNGRSMTFQYPGSPNRALFMTDYNWEENDTLNITYSRQIVNLLQTISTSDSIPIQIFFDATEESHKMYEHPNYSQCGKILKLDSIRICGGGRKIASAALSYSYRNFTMVYGANNYYWRYLSSVRISGLGTYTLTYDEINPYPDSPFPMIFTYPSLNVTTDAEYKSLVDRRGFWNVLPTQGMLSKVTLPTGGNIRFSYSTHQYGEERRFRKINTCDVELYSLNSSDQTIGGARITKIETFADANTLVEKDTFIYTKPNSTGSSGIYYNIYEIFDSSGNTRAIVNPYNYGMIDSHIGYSYVRRHKTIGSETYKTTYTYATGHTTYTSAYNPMINRRTNLPNYTNDKELYSGSLTYSEHMRRTGNLLAVESYKGNTIQKSTYFRYNGVPNPLIDWSSLGLPSLELVDTVVCMSNYAGHITRKLFVYPNRLEQTVTYEYPFGSNGQPMVSPTSYTYDSKLRKKQTITIDSRGRKNFVRYTYPDDISSAGDHALGLLVRAHRINVPVEEISGYIDGSNNEYITAGIVNMYNVGLIATVYPGSHGDSMAWGEITDSYPYLYRTKQLSLSEPLPVTEYQPLHVSNWNTISDPHYSLVCEYQFDRWNRLLSSNPLGKLKTEYKWEGFFPVSKTTGDQTWTYTYIPYVGISSMTDPRGLTTCYTYDSVGRLVEVYQIIDGRKRILNAYQYHIKTE